MLLEPGQQPGQLAGQLAGTVVLFRAADRPEEGLGVDYGWGRWAARVEVVEVPGDHATMLRSPHVETLALRLANWLVEEER